MSLSVSLVCAGACSFTRPPALGDDGDAGVTGDGAMPLGDTPEVTAVVPCGTPDSSGLVLCLELEDGVDDGTLRDSAPGHRDATTTGLAPDTRTVPAISKAARIGATSVTRVADDPAFDLAAGYTSAVWIRPETLPPVGSAYGLIDHELQYAMVIGHSPEDDSLQNRCVHTGVTRFEWTEVLPVSTWSFVACTWDGSELCAYRWTSTTSHEHFCHVAETPPSTTGSNGLAIGHLSNNGAAHSRFDGELDSLQLYNRGLSADQLCALIGQPAGCLPCTSGSCEE